MPTEKLPPDDVVAVLASGDTLPAVDGSGGDGARPSVPIGPYRLVRKLGEGGMGEVWEADQQAPVRRRVALKLIKLGMGSREIVARFASERQALALMQHPSIAQIFDAGTTSDDRPYFAMELVDGLPITRHCDDQRLDVSARLRLYQKVCEAVQHAHRKGVIHRDLKPSNILVSGQAGAAIPKVIDFGLAMATEADLGLRTKTDHGAWVGTPAYASPEQMHLIPGGVDTRSDVYSLAMILYELLVGALPFDLEGTASPADFELQRRMQEEPPRPSARFAALPNRSAIADARRSDAAALRRRLRGDLGWIVLKGLERDPERRYGSVDELSADLGRHLADEPVLAGPPTARYRLRKFVRRHVAGVAAASGLLLLIVGFAVTMAIQARRIAGERDRAEAEAAKSAAISTFLEETIGAADPWRTGREVSVRETLGKAAARVDASFQGQPLVAAAVRRAIGNTLSDLGQYGDAAPVLEGALATRARLLPPDHLEVAESHADLGVMFELSGDLAQAESHDRAALAIRRARLGDHDPLVADALEHLSKALFQRGEYDAAERAAAESLSIREAKFGPKSKEASQSLSTLGSIASAGRGDNAKGDTLLLRAVEIRRAVLGPDDPLTAQAVNELAVVRHGQGKFTDAEALYREALAIDRAKLGPDNPETAVVMENLGGALLAQQRYDEVLALLGEVLEVRRAKLGADSPTVTRTMLNIATTNMMAGHLEVADAGFVAALPRIRAERGEDPDVATTIGNLAWLRAKEGRNGDAEDLYRQALAIEVRTMPDGHPLLARQRLEVAKLLIARGQHAEAEKLIVAARDALEKASGKESTDVRRAGEVLAQLYDKWGKPDEAARVRAGMPKPTPTPP